MMQTTRGPAFRGFAGINKGFRLHRRGSAKPLLMHPFQRLAKTLKHHVYCPLEEIDAYIKHHNLDHKPSRARGNPPRSVSHQIVDQLVI